MACGTYSSSCWDDHVTCIDIAIVFEDLCETRPGSITLISEVIVIKLLVRVLILSKEVLESVPIIAIRTIHRHEVALIPSHIGLLLRLSVLLYLTDIQIIEITREVLLVVPMSGLLLNNIAVVILNWLPNDRL